MKLMTISCFATAALGEQTRFDSDSKPIAIDNCSSLCLTNSRSDFIPGTVKSCNVRILGVGGRVKCKVKGTVSWTIEDDQGRAHDIIIPHTPLHPDLPHRLLSPQHWAQETERRERVPIRGKLRASCKTNAVETIMSWGLGRFTKTVALDKDKNISVMMTKSGSNKFSAFASTVESLEPEVSCFVATGAPSPPALPIVTDGEESTSTSSVSTCEEEEVEDGSNNKDAPIQVDFENHPDQGVLSTESDTPMDNDKDEMYRRHVRAGHLSFSKIRAMARRGEVPGKLAKCASPMCAACQFGKATRKAWRTKAQVRGIKVVTKPGECVSVDQIESRTPGLLVQIKGRLTNARYGVATIFVDHYSRLGYVHLQASTSSKDTLTAKRAFEVFARDHGVTIKHYHADNGRFIDNAWKGALDAENQGITYCGVNAHWQNGVAERRIRDLKEQARTMLLHAQHHWPDAIETSLWPYALRYACAIFNDAPTLKGQNKDCTPLELFTGTKVLAEVRNHHTFGCPVYVLETALQENKSLPAWMSRARVGINIGISPTHARSVSLVLSLKTGLASPQFHTKHDDLFETTQRKKGGYRMPRSQWQSISGFTKPQAIVPPMDRDAEADSERRQRAGTQQQGSNGNHRATTTLAHVGDAEQLAAVEGDETTMPDENEPQGNEPSGLGHTHEDETDPPHASGHHEEDQPQNEKHPLEGSGGGTTRSGRRIKITQRARESHYQRGRDWVTWLARITRQNELPREDEIYEIFAHREYDIQDQASDPIAFTATSDPDTMYWHQAMQQPDRAEFLKAAKAEMDSHVDNKHVKLTERKDLPVGTKVLASVWSMKRKRRILTREIYKWKARLNAHGGQQEHGVNFWETYAPVVNWFSIRLFLVISILQDWETRQIDFVLAFPQADVECDMYMEIPPGFNLKQGTKKQYCLKLTKNIYGTKQAGRVWNKHLHKGLTELGYVASKIDPCVYYKGKTVFMVYVDDGIFAGPDKQEINGLLAQLTKKFTITDEGDLTEYLGVLVEKKLDGRTKLSQPHLIKQMLDDLWFNERTKSKPTPAPGGQVLQREIDAEEMADDFHYRSVVGKGNFLEKSTRPDIAVAMHQCARFSSDPKQSHANALRYIGKYLSGTKDEGIYLDPQQDKSFECWVDADFLGQYVKGATDMHLDAMTAKSRTGYLITYAGCPITWGSKLQRESALSTTESEYMAISESFRSLLPMMDLLEEAREKGVPVRSGPPVVHCKAFEDNSGAMELARLPKMRPRTKHINVKYHHFREAVAKGRVTVQHVASKDQLGDALTKNLPRDLFLSLRKRYAGW
jgi:hypothetical protein